MQTLDKLMPKILDVLAHEKNAYITLERLCSLFETMAGRNVYLSLLAENDHALQQLITLTSSSSWISEYLAKYPALFDELLDTRSLY
ncbi:[weak similarity to] [glutamate--ammonia-ligase] adenylyltransferase, partial [methanotrophic bacterial endosymbiont of Bathymodiolus sp.]